MQVVLFLLPLASLHRNSADYNMSTLNLDPVVTVSCVWRSSLCCSIRLKVTVTWQPAHALSHQASQSYAGWHATLTLSWLHPVPYLWGQTMSDMHDAVQEGSHFTASTMRCPDDFYYCNTIKIMYFMWGLHWHDDKFQCIRLDSVSIYKVGSSVSAYIWIWLINKASS